MTTRRCAQCGREFMTTRKARYCSGACRTAGWKAKVDYADPRQRKASRNVKPKRKRKPEVRLTFTNAVAAAKEAADLTANEIYDQLDGAPYSPIDIEACVRRRLTDRQRQSLQEKETAT